MKILFGNKIDLERKVSETDVKLYAETLKIDYLETSAKSGENVETAFLSFAEMLQKHSDQQKES